MATTDMATISQALLALYGALDQAVTGTGDPQIEAVVERYLPHSTGADAGWYDQLLAFLQRPGLGGPGTPEAPDLGQALDVLQATGQTRAVHTQAMDTAVEQLPAALTLVEASRLVYAVGALAHLPSYYPPEQWQDRFAGALAAAGTSGGAELLDLLRRDFTGRTEWASAMQAAVRDSLITAEVAEVPLCSARPKWVRGHGCVVLTTEFTSVTVSLDQLKNVVDPLNWSRCLPFFCLMQPEPVRADGWSRVLEHVGAACPIPAAPQLVTPLKYWKGPPLPEPTAFIDYAIDDDPAPDEHGDGLVVVDEGFIRMTSTAGDASQAGVRVRTRKVLAFRNLAAVPTAIFACVMGYGSEGAAMLLGGVARHADSGPTGWTKWEPSKPSAVIASAPQAGPAPAGDGDFGRRAVLLAADMLNECAAEMSQRSAALAEKWATGDVRLDESVRFAADLTVRLATDPWRYLERLRRCVPHPADDRELSEFLQAPPDPEDRRTLSVAGPFVRDGTSYAIPRELIVFVPAALDCYATRFRVAVVGPDYHCGTYRGRVRLTSRRSARVHELDVVVDL